MWRLTQTHRLPRRTFQRQSLQSTQTLPWLPGGLQPFALPTCGSFRFLYLREEGPAGPMLWSRWRWFQADGRTWNSTFHCQFLCLVLRVESWGLVFVFFFQCILIHACQCLLRCLQAFGSSASGSGGILLTSSLLCFDVFSCLSILCP